MSLKIFLFFILTFFIIENAKSHLTVTFDDVQNSISYDYLGETIATIATISFSDQGITIGLSDSSITLEKNNSIDSYKKLLQQKNLFSEEEFFYFVLFYLLPLEECIKLHDFFQNNEILDQDQTDQDLLRKKNSDFFCIYINRMNLIHHAVTLKDRGFLEKVKNYLERTKQIKEINSIFFSFNPEKHTPAHLALENASPYHFLSWSQKTSKSKNISDHMLEFFALLSLSKDQNLSDDYMRFFLEGLKSF